MMAGVPDGHETPSSTATGEQGQGRHILVVDDEASVRRITERVLQRAGYRVTVAADGLDALERYEQAGGSGGSIDLVVSDILMPRMDGLTLVRELAVRTPGLPVVLISGHTGEYQVQDSNSGERIAVLPKPFKVQELLACVTEALARACAPGPSAPVR